MTKELKFLVSGDVDLQWSSRIWLPQKGTKWVETRSRWWKGHYLGKPSHSPIIPNSCLLRSSIIQDEQWRRGGSCAVRIKDDNRTKSRKTCGLCVLIQGFIQGFSLQSLLSTFISTVYLRKENKIKWWQITHDRRYIIISVDPIQKWPETIFASNISQTMAQ